MSSISPLITVMLPYIWSDFNFPVSLLHNVRKGKFESEEETLMQFSADEPEVCVETVDWTLYLLSEDLPSFSKFETFLKFLVIYDSLKLWLD